MRKELFLIALSLVVALAMAEGALRLFPGLLPLELRVALEDEPGEGWISHPYIGNLRTPSSTGIIRTSDFAVPYQTDAKGFRNGYPWPDEVDIVAVGDSLTFGYGVERDEAWPSLVGQALPEARIVNLGLIGAGPQQYARIYETFGVPLHPKILLIGFFARNDFWDAEMFDTWLKSGVGGNYMIWRDFGRADARSGMNQPLTEAMLFLQSNSYLYSLLRYARNAFRSWQSDEPKVLDLPGGDRLRLTPNDLETKTANAKPGSPLFGVVVSALEHMQAIAARDGTRMIVVFQPSKEEVYLPLFDGSAPDPGAPLRAALDVRGIEYLDLLPAFRERAERGANLFFETDGHPNRDGYRLIADEVSAYLRANVAGENLVGVTGLLANEGQPAPRSVKDRQDDPGG